MDVTLKMPQIGIIPTLYLIAWASLLMAYFATRRASILWARYKKEHDYVAENMSTFWSFVSILLFIKGIIFNIIGTVALLSAHFPK